MSKKSEIYGIYVGAETGLLKGVKADHSSWQNLTSVNTVSREKEITAMCWQDDDQTDLCIGHRDGSIDIFNCFDKEIIQSYTNIVTGGYLKGLVKWNSAFLTCTDTGKLKLVDGTEEKLAMDVGADIYCFRQNPEQKHIIATGGKENDLKIWDLEQPQEPIFKAKNVRNDWLNLRVPIWVRDAAFLSGSNKIVTCTGHHQVRVYDPSTPRRRPVIDIEVDEYPLTSLSLRHGYKQVVVGNTHGMMALIDIRGKGYLAQKYKGFAGSIRDIQCHPSEDIVVSCSLDRFLRIHDINNKQLLTKFYMKSRLNRCLVADKATGYIPTSPLLSAGEIKEEPTETKTYSGEETVSSEDEQLWSCLRTVKTKEIKKRSKSSKELKPVEHSEDGVSNKQIAEEEDLEEDKTETNVVKRKQSQYRKGKKKMKRSDQK